MSYIILTAPFYHSSAVLVNLLLIRLNIKLA